VPANKPAARAANKPAPVAEAAAALEAQNTPEKPSAVPDLFELAAADQGGYTLIPAGKVKNNPTVKAVEPAVEKDGMVVCKRL
jgi:hypothetical protein